MGQQGRPRSSSHHIIHQPCRADGVLPEHLTVCQMPESRSKVQTSLRSIPSAARPPNTNAFSRMAAHACPERGAGRSAAEPFCWGVNHFMVSVLKTATSDVVLSLLRPAIVRTCVHRVPVSCMRKYYRRIFHDGPTLVRPTTVLPCARTGMKSRAVLGRSHTHVSTLRTATSVPEVSLMDVRFEPPHSTSCFPP